MPMTADSLPGVLSSACAEVREAGPEDLVAGVAPRFVARPASVAEAAAVMRAAADEGLAALPRGTGTRLAWGCPPARCDLVIDTRALNRVLEHAAGDLVVRVQAGVGLDQLAATLAVAGQRLALDPPAAPSSSSAGRRNSPGAANGAGTIGGVLATGVAGPLRLRYGTPRDLAIGITVVRADGTVASSGGKVVKNVAGYDLGKLFAGSYGTLGLIVEAAFRLHPLPAATAFVTLEAADADGAQAAVAAAAQSPLAPVAAEIDRPSREGPVRVGVLLEGDAEGVAERCARLTGLLGDGASAAPTAPAWWGRGAAAEPDGTVVRIGFWAEALARVLDAVDAAASDAGLDPLVGGSAAAGVIHAAVPEGASAAAVARFVGGLRAALGGPSVAPAAAAELAATAPPGWPPSPVSVPRSAAGASRSAAGASRSAAGASRSAADVSPSPADVSPSPAGVSPSAADGPPSWASAVVLHAPAEVRAVVDLWGPVPSIGLMRAVKAQFDPEHRMAPGRFAGGI
jgi:glycolate oxidase FAD binding subunit